MVYDNIGYAKMSDGVVFVFDTPYLLLYSFGSCNKYCEVNFISIMTPMKIT